MNKRTLLVTLVGACCMVGSSYACTYPDVRIWAPYEFWVVPGHPVEIQADELRGVCLSEWWWVPEGAYVSEHDGCWGLAGWSRREFTFGAVGVYDVNAHAENDDGEDWDWATVYVATMGFSPSPPFPYIAVNDDDDDENRRMDNYNSDPDGPLENGVPYDDDLVPLPIECNSMRGSPDLIELSIVHITDVLQVWEQRNRSGLLIGNGDLGQDWTPGALWSKTVYVEGMYASTGQGQTYDPWLWWYYFGYLGPWTERPSLEGWNGTDASRKRWIVVHVDMDMPTVQDDYDENNNRTTEETTPGGFIPVGDFAELTVRRVKPESVNPPVYNWNGLTLSVPNGADKVQIWDQSTMELVFPPYPFSLVGQDRTFLVEARELSSAARDITLCLTQDVTNFKDKINLTVIDVNLTASDLFGTVSEPNEETVGAFVHFNLDNDNDSDNNVPSSKHPGADCNEPNTVTGENDLRLVTMSLSPALTVGTVALTNMTGGKIWKSQTKGSANLVMPALNKTWDLSDPNERSEFLSLCSSLFIEGVSLSGGNLMLQYIAPNRSEATDSDTIKYTFIAADCGVQPTTAEESIYYEVPPSNWEEFSGHKQRNYLEGYFGGLQRCEYSITDNLAPRSWSNGKRCTLPEYNCIAWSVGETNTVYEQDYIATNYGNKNGIFEVEDMDDFYYQKKGWKMIYGGTDPAQQEAAAKEAEAMYYSIYHGARKKACTCGAGKWIMYESKCGQWERIEHVWDQLNGRYGTPIRFYK